MRALPEANHEPLYKKYSEELSKLDLGNLMGPFWCPISSATSNTTTIVINVVNYHVFRYNNSALY